MHEISVKIQQPYLYIMCNATRYAVAINLYGGDIITRSHSVFVYVCGDGIASASTHSDHINISNKESYIKCRVCDKPFLEREDLIALDTLCRIGGGDAMMEYLQGWLHYTRYLS